MSNEESRTDVDERDRVDSGEGMTDSGDDLTGGYGANPSRPDDRGDVERHASRAPDDLGSTDEESGLTSGGYGTGIPEETGLGTGGA